MYKLADYRSPTPNDNDHGGSSEGLNFNASQDKQRMRPRRKNAPCGRSCRTPRRGPCWTTACGPRSSPSAPPPPRGDCCSFREPRCLRRYQTESEGGQPGADDKLVKNLVWRSREEVSYADTTAAAANLTIAIAPTDQQRQFSASTKTTAPSSTHVSIYRFQSAILSHADGRSPVGDAVLEGVHVGRLVEAGQSALVTLIVVGGTSVAHTHGGIRAAKFWFRVCKTYINYCTLDSFIPTWMAQTCSRLKTRTCCCASKYARAILWDDHRGQYMH